MTDLSNDYELIFKHFGVSQIEYFSQNDRLETFILKRDY